MPYKISGEIDVTGTVQLIVVDEASWTTEHSSSKSSGAYEVLSLASGTKTVLARTASEGQVVGFGNVPAVYYT
jgi:hypothetical protein